MLFDAEHAARLQRGEHAGKHPLGDAFGPALSAADHVVLTDIYAAGEDPIPGVTLEALAASVRRSTSGPVDIVPNVADVPAALARVARRGDVVITLGAGSIGGVAEKLISLLATPQSSSVGGIL